MTQKQKFGKVNNFDRADLLNFWRISQKENHIPLVISYNWTAPNMSKIMQKLLPILQINEIDQKIIYKNSDNIIKKNEKP